LQLLYQTATIYNKQDRQQASAILHISVIIVCTNNSPWANL